MTTIERIIELLAERNISASKMMRDLEFSKGLFSQWKAGKQKPSVKKLQKISEYFNVSMDYLLTGKQSETDPVDEELAILARKTKELPEAEREKLIAVLRGTVDTFLEAQKKHD